MGRTMKQTEYTVTWTINLEADNPQEAAEMARHYMTRPDTTATVFEIIGNRITTTVDLLEQHAPAAR